MPFVLPKNSPVKINRKDLIDCNLNEIYISVFDKLNRKKLSNLIKPINDLKIESTKILNSRLLIPEEVVNSEIVELENYSLKLTSNKVFKNKIIKFKGNILSLIHI